MRRQRRVGLVGFWVFLLGILVNLPNRFINAAHADPWNNWPINSSYWYMIPLCLMFAASIKWKKMRLFHALIFVIHGVCTAFWSPLSVIGVLSYELGFFLFFLYGYLNKNFLWKAIPLAVVLVALIPIAAMVRGITDAGTLIDLTVGPVAFFCIMVVVFWDEIMGLVAPPAQKRETVDLATKKLGLSMLERIILQKVLDHKTPKEIYDDLIHEGFTQTKDTVYKARKRAFKKLGFNSDGEFLHSTQTIDYIDRSLRGTYLK